MTFSKLITVKSKIYWSIYVFDLKKMLTKSLRRWSVICFCKKKMSFSLIQSVTFYINLSKYLHILFKSDLCG